MHFYYLSVGQQKVKIALFKVFIQNYDDER